MLGVYDPNLTGVIACVLRNLGTQRAMVVHGSDGLDEITHTGRTRVSELNGDQIRTYYLEPEGLGIRQGSLEEIVGGVAVDNARITREVLAGRPGPCRDVVLMPPPPYWWVARWTPCWTGCAWRRRSSIPGRPWPSWTV